MFLTGDHQLQVKLGTDDDGDVVEGVVVVINVELEEVLNVDGWKGGPGKFSLLGGSNSRNGSLVLLKIVVVVAVVVVVVFDDDDDGRGVVVVSLAFLAIH